MTKCRIFMEKKTKLVSMKKNQLPKCYYKKKCNLIFILSKLVYTKICSIVQLMVTILALFTHYPSIMVH
jgi:hypothetical protein